MSGSKAPSGEMKHKLPTYCCIALLESCFLRCRMCYKWRSDVNYRDPQEPDPGQWRGFISSLSDMVGPGFKINFAGGEPLARRESLEFVKFASSKGMDTLLATNGFLLDKDMVLRIGDSGLNLLSISLDSITEDLHDRIRGKKGVFRKVMEGLELMDKYAGHVQIGICTVIMQDNLRELGRIVRWVQGNNKIDGMGFQAVTQPFSTPEDPMWYKNPEYSHLWPNDISCIDACLDELIELKRLGLSKLGNPLAQFYVYKAYFRDPNKFIKRDTCHIDDSVINITPTGEIRICFYMDKIGDIKTDDIKDAWFSDKAEGVRNQISACRRNCQAMVNCNFDDSQSYVKG